MRSLPAPLPACAGARRQDPAPGVARIGVAAVLRGAAVGRGAGVEAAEVRVVVQKAARVFARVKGEERLGEVRQLVAVGLQAQGSKSMSRPNPSNPKSRHLNSQMGSRPGGRARSDGGRGARGPRGRSTARSVPALLLLATGSLLLHLLLAGPAPPGAAAQPQPGGASPARSRRRRGGRGRSPGARRPSWLPTPAGSGRPTGSSSSGTPP